MSNCSSNCSSGNCSGCEVEQTCSAKNQPLFKAPHPRSHIQKVIGVSSAKGGVGKSMITSLLATAMQQKGYSVGVLDADITGPSIPKSFGITDKAIGTEDGLFPVKSKNGIDIMSLNLLVENATDPVAWRGPVIAGCVQQFWTDVIWGHKDILFIDMPPGTGDVMLTLYQSLPIDGVILVITPQDLVGMIVEKGIKLANMMNIPILGLVENMSYVSCPDCDCRIPIFGESQVEKISKLHNIEHIAKLPVKPEIAKYMDNGKIEQYHGEWLINIQNAIDDLF